MVLYFHIYMYTYILSLPIVYGSYSQFFLPYWSWRILIPGKYWAAAKLGLVCVCVLDGREGKGVAKKYGSKFMKDQNAKTYLLRDSTACWRQLL